MFNDNLVDIKYSSFELGLTKQFLCVVAPAPGCIGALLIRRVANQFLRQESQNL